MSKRAKDKVVHASKLVIRFLGPVARSVHGQLSRPEIARSIVQAIVNGGATWGTLKVTIAQPSTVTEVVVPLCAATFTGVMDALGRLEHGEPKVIGGNVPAMTAVTPTPPVPRAPSPPKSVEL